MVSLTQLAKHGITEEKLKELFTSVEYPLSGSVTPGKEKITKLAQRVRTRTQDGILNNFKMYKPYFAIDRAWDVPFRQISPTLMGALADGNFDQETLLSCAKDWGLTHMLQEKIDPKTGKETGEKYLSLPTFFSVFVPLVRAYVTIRAARLTQDRDLYPHFKFEPLKSDPINRARCEIITDRIEAMVTQMGLRDIGKQAILRMLIYGVQMMFIQEEWFKEEQLNEEGETYVSKEGLRYHLPHPTRTYYDRAQPLSSINTDTGMEYLGYWRVRRFRDVRLNMKLWNQDRIAYNSVDLRRDNAIFFNTVYSTCTLQFPQSLSKFEDLDRESDMQHKFYTSDFDDSALVLNEHFEKIIPEDDGIGTYKYPVWFRFVTGGDGTILYAAPLPDTPAVYLGYDPEESRSMQSSLALEVLPFQDQISNLLTQALLSVRQNLSNLTFVDQDIVDEKSLKTIENAGEAMFRKLNFLRFSGRKTRAAQQDVRYAFGSVRFPQLDVPQILGAINAVLAVLERVLVMSAQEIAGQATHEQSKEEIVNVKASTSTRLGYTGMGVDRGWEAWKRQLYSFLMAFGSPDVYAHLSHDPEYTPELLGVLGFTVVNKAKRLDSKHLVSGKKAMLQVEYFASTRDGAQRVNDTALAQAMLQMLGNALQNPMVAQAIGPEQSILLLNKVLEEMGLPEDFKLQAIPPQAPSDEQQKWLQAQLMELSKQVKEFVTKGQAETIKKFSDSTKQLIEQVRAVGSDNKDNKLAIAKIIDFLHSQPKIENDSGRTTPALTIGGSAS